MKKSVALSHPIKFGEETIERLEFRQPVAQDFREMSLSPKVGDYLDLAARLSGLPPSAIGLLSAQDMTEVLLIMGEFQGGGPETGNAP